MRRKKRRAMRKGPSTTPSISRSGGMENLSLTGSTSFTGSGWSSSARSAAISATRVGGISTGTSKNGVTRTACDAWASRIRSTSTTSSLSRTHETSTPRSKTRWTRSSGTPKTTRSTKTGRATCSTDAPTRIWPAKASCNGVVALRGAETAGREREKGSGHGSEDAPRCSSVCWGVGDGGTCAAAAASAGAAAACAALVSGMDKARARFAGLLLLPLDLLGVRAHVAYQTLVECLLLSRFRCPRELQVQGPASSSLVWDECVVVRSVFRR